MDLSSLISTTATKMKMKTTTMETERYHVSKIKQSNLTMAAQGFRSEASSRRSASADASSDKRYAGNANDYTPFDPTSVDYHGMNFQKNHCYVFTEGDNITVGIQRFVSNDSAQCIVIEKFDNTLLQQSMP